MWCSFPVFRWKDRNFESKKPKEQSATCVVAASQREDKSVVSQGLDVQIRVIYVLHKAIY